MIRSTPRCLTLALAAALFLTAQAHAQTVVLQADRMLDVRTGDMLEDVTLVITDGVITGVDPDVVPAIASTDLGDVTLLPGFMDAHVHLGNDLEEGWDVRGVRETTADAVIRGVCTHGRPWKRVSPRCGISDPASSWTSR